MSYISTLYTQLLRVTNYDFNILQNLILKEFVL